MGFDFDFGFYGLWVVGGPLGGGGGSWWCGIQIDYGEVLEVLVWCGGGLKATVVVAA